MTVLERARQSWTMRAAKWFAGINAVLLLIDEVLPAVVSVIGDPTLGGYVQQFLPPRWLAVWNILVAVVFAAARMRSLLRAP